MKIRMALKEDYRELALAEWDWVSEEDDGGDKEIVDLPYVDKLGFIREFVEYLEKEPGYKIFIAEEDNKVLAAMFVYMIPKIPRPHITVKYISYLTNVFTLKAYRNQGIGTELLRYVQNSVCSKKVN